MTPERRAAETVTLKRVRALQRKANSIHRKAEALASEVLDVYGDTGQVAGPLSNIISDDSDSLLHMAEEMCFSLDNAVAYLKGGRK